MGLVLAIPTLYQEAVVDLQPSAISSAYNHLHLLYLVTTAHMVQVVLSFQGEHSDVYKTMNKTIV